MGESCWDKVAVSSAILFTSEESLGNKSEILINQRLEILVILVSVVEKYQSIS